MMDVCGCDWFDRRVCPADIGSSRDDAYPDALASLARGTGGVCYQAVIDGAGTLELHDRGGR